MKNNDALAQSLISGGFLRTPRIIAAFRAIDRAHFVPEKLQHEAYGDYPLPIGAGQTISQPRTVAFLLEHLQAAPGQAALDVGTGSGWTTALIRHIVGSAGRVVGVERVPELCAFGKRNVERYFPAGDPAVEMHCGNASLEQWAQQTFDRILSGATAKKDIPRRWRDALLTGGRIVAPVGDSVRVFEKYPSGRWREAKYPGFSFVPLIEET